MSLVLGVGGRPGADAADLAALVEEALAEERLAARDITVVATLDRRAREDAVTSLASRLGAPVAAFTAEVLARQEVPHPSEVVQRHTGASGVAEAAVLACGARLVLTKRRGPGWTVAIGQVDPPQEAS
jgi:cobalamin biosynthesis protein CbiG